MLPERCSFPFTHGAVAFHHCVPRDAVTRDFACVNSNDTDDAGAAGGGRGQRWGVCNAGCFDEKLGHGDGVQGTEACDALI